MRGERGEYLDEEKKGFLVLTTVALDGSGQVLGGREERVIPCGTEREWGCG